jgi:hypothetical protein
VETPEEPIPTDLGVLADGTAVLLRYIGRDAEEPASPRRALFALDAGGRSPRLPGACDLFPSGYRLAGVDGEDLVFLDLQGRRFVWLPPRCRDEE